MFSHVFAFTVVVTFVFLGLWQLNRHGERADRNEIIEARSTPPAISINEALALPGDEFDFQFVEVSGTFIDEDLVRVANRSQGGSAGEHVAALFELDDGRRLLVNRGFVPLGAPGGIEAAPTGRVVLDGWLQASVTKGFFGATDIDSRDVAPRFDVDAIGRRVENNGELLPFWLLLDGADEGASLVGFPAPVPLPELNSGPHLSYMGQWFIFATLGIGFYLVLLRRNAKGKAAPVLLDD